MATTAFATSRDLVGSLDLKFLEAQHIQLGRDVVTGKMQLVQLVVGNASTLQQRKRKSPSPPVEKEEEEQGFKCTICKQTYTKKAAFNAHIKAHLKEKLNTRREKKREEEKEEREPAAVSCSPSVQNKKRMRMAKAPSPKTEERPMQRVMLAKPTPPTYSQVMAELAACKPIPPHPQKVQPQATLTIIPTVPSVQPNPPPSAAATTTTSATTATTVVGNTPDISDMEDDLMSYEMEMNRIDFHQDLSCILDQIEKDFASPCIANEVGLDTPPDSDSETGDYISTLFNDPSLVNLGLASSSLALPTGPNMDLLGFDQFARQIPDAPICGDSLMSPLSECLPLPPPLPAAAAPAKLAQSPASLAKVGPLPAKALAVLSQLPSKIFSSNDDSTRLVNVVKVERSNVVPESSSSSKGQAPELAAVNDYTVINIECHRQGKNGEPDGKIIETYKAVDNGGGEIKLVLSNAAVKVGPSTVQSDTKVQRTFAPAEAKKAETPPPPVPKRMHACKMCEKTFSQRGHLNRHEKTHRINEEQLRCRICNKQCKNKVSLMRHRSRHLACLQCSTVFEYRTDLQRHLAKMHPETAASISAVIETKPSILSEDSKPPPAPATKGDSFLVSAAVTDAESSLEEDDEEEGEEGEKDGSLDAIGESLADISNSDFFQFSQELNDELYSPDLF